MVDLPEAGRPVSHTVAPRCSSARQRSSRVMPPACQVTFGERAPASVIAAEAESPVSASTIMPAPTVSFDASSTRMKLPVWRLRRGAVPPNRGAGGGGGPPPAVGWGGGGGGLRGGAGRAPPGGPAPPPAGA